jgi:hypothetical protein
VASLDFHFLAHGSRSDGYMGSLKNERLLIQVRCRSGRSSTDDNQMKSVQRAGRGSIAIYHGMRKRPWHDKESRMDTMSWSLNCNPGPFIRAPLRTSFAQYAPPPTVFSVRVTPSARGRRSITFAKGFNPLRWDNLFGRSGTARISPFHKTFWH